MFQNLGNKLQDIFKSLRGRGKLTEADVKAVLGEVRVALLEADVNLEVAKTFIEKVQEKASGSEVLQSLKPDQQVISIVNEELIELLGGKAVQPVLNANNNLWLLMGLQGTGKTTTAGKIAHKYKNQGRKPLLIAADTQRPAAREQLSILGKQINIPVFEVEDNEKPKNIKKRLDKYLAKNFHDLVIVDTAGRLQIDEALMDDLAELKKVLKPSESILAIDAMTGQQSLPVVKTFDERIGGITGLIMTKLDGDARGGAALSARHVTGKPIYFAGVSEKIDGLEPFYPDRIAGRVLGMGDMLTLIEKAKALGAEEEEIKDAKEFNLEHLLDQIRKMKQMGSVTDLAKMIPGVSNMMPEEGVDEKQFTYFEAILCSMTPTERLKPKTLDASRRKRIALGSGTNVQTVNMLMKHYQEMKKVMKMMGTRGGMRRLRGLGLGGFGGGGLEALESLPDLETAGAGTRSGRQRPKQRKKKSRR